MEWKLLINSSLCVLLSEVEWLSEDKDEEGGRKERKKGYRQPSH
jgi:hypothetical protein